MTTSSTNVLCNYFVKIDFRDLNAVLQEQSTLFLKAILKNIKGFVIQCIYDLCLLFQ